MYRIPSSSRSLLAGRSYLLEEVGDEVLGLVADAVPLRRGEVELGGLDGDEDLRRGGGGGVS